MSTITREFTKEQLIASAHARIEFAEMMLSGELEPLKERTWSIEMELARIALASLEAEAVADVVAWSSPNEERTCDIRLRRHDITAGPLYTAPPAPIEAEPVAYMWDSDRKDVDAPGYYRPEHKIFAESSVKRYGGKVVALYAAPPSPVSVPDEVTTEDCPALVKYDVTDIDEAWARGFNKCRDAMLQGADGNSPVIQDGWVACSERMPAAIGEYLVAYKWMNRWIYQKVITFAHLSEYTNEMGWNSDLEITHWMPLPAAPQQGG